MSEWRLNDCMSSVGRRAWESGQFSPQEGSGANRLELRSLDGGILTIADSPYPRVRNREQNRAQKGTKKAILGGG
jgi:hypothetical protein